MQARDLAERLHLDRSARSWRGSCPSCAYPRAFSVRAGQAGTALIYCANGCDRAELRATVGRIVGNDYRAPVHDAPTQAAAGIRRQGAALRLWEGSSPAAGTPADTYLTWRGLAGLAGSPALRFRPDAPHPECGKLPALIALVTATTGSPAAIHRTYLTPDGQGKANVDPNRASLGPVWGAAIRLAAPGADGAVVIGEGIETAASAGRLIGLPAWAAISAGNLARGLILPPEVRRVVIAVDPDLPGEAAAQAAAERWQRAGLHVQVAHPKGAGDFNDLLQARIVNHAG